MAAERVTVLVVCTGNVCRSPAVERLLRSMLSEASGIEVSSAGAAALVGSPIDPQVAELLVSRGVDASGFTARQVTSDMVIAADLVLGVTRWHRAVAAQLHPRAVQRSFTLRQFARLAHEAGPDVTAQVPNGGPAERLKALLSVLPSIHARLPVVRAAEDDIVDPYSAGRRVHAKVFRQVSSATQAIGQALWVAPPSSSAESVLRTSDGPPRSR